MKRMKAAVRRLGAPALVLLSTALVMGCGAGRGRGAPDSTLQVTIQNHDFKDAVIYANWVGSTRHRVGMVTGKTSETFTVRMQMPTVRFEARLIAGETVRFEPIPVMEGDHLDLVIMIQGQQ